MKKKSLALAVESYNAFIAVVICSGLIVMILLIRASQEDKRESTVAEIRAAIAECPGVTEMVKEEAHIIRTHTLRSFSTVCKAKAYGEDDSAKANAIKTKVFQDVAR